MHGLEDRDNVLCVNEEWMHAMLYTTHVQFVRPTLGFLPASFSLSISRPYCVWRTPTIAHLGTPSSVSKECSQAYINCQNLLSLSFNTDIVGFVFHFKSTTLVEVFWPRRLSDVFRGNTLAAKSKTWG